MIRAFFIGIVNMASITDFCACCTAKIHWDIPEDWQDVNTAAKNQIIEGYKRNVENSTSGCALYVAIALDNQREFLKALGWEKVFVAKKDEVYNCRHMEEGPLNLYAIQPWVLKENIREYLMKLKDDGKPTKEEIARRESFPAFRFVDLIKTETWTNLFEGKKIVRADPFPVALAHRNQLFSEINKMTGGFDPRRDPIITTEINARRLTWGVLKDRCELYRKGDI
jgi:hypothetical protein